MHAIGRAIFAHGLDPIITGALGAGTAVAAAALNVTLLAVNPLHALIFCAATKSTLNILDLPFNWINSKLRTEQLDEFRECEEANPFINRQIIESLVLASRIAAFALTAFLTPLLAPEMVIPVLTGVAIYTAASLAKALVYSLSYKAGQHFYPNPADQDDEVID